MSWVLILNSDITAKPPAVIGGYATCDEAETAGDLATNVQGLGQWVNAPFYTHYVVIPGAACSEPLATVHADVRRSDDYTQWELIKRRWPDANG